MNPFKKEKDRVTIPAVLYNVTEQMKKEIDTFMFDYGFMFRYAFNRYVELEAKISDRKELQKEVQKLEKELVVKTKYPIRVAKDAVADAIQLVKARHILMKEYYELWKERYEKTTALYEKLSVIPEINQHSFRILGLKNKMERQYRNVQFYSEQMANHTFPSVVFGGKKNFKKLQNGKLTKTEWNDLRNGRLSSRGDATKGGNPNLRVIETERGFGLQITSNRNISKGEKPVYEKTILPLYIATKHCKQTGELKGRKYPEMMNRVLEKGSAYEVEILRRNDNYYVHIVVKEEKPPVNNQYEGVLSFDTNIDGLALCHVNEKGTPLHFEWVGDGGLQYYASNKRENKIWEMAHSVVKYALKHNVAVGAEDLGEMKNPNMGKKLRRKIHQFCYKKIVECVEVLCNRYGIKFIKVKPHYTSIIGRLKYQTKYRVNVHLSAAFVIGRRVLKIKEKIPKKLFSILTEKQKENSESHNEWKQWSTLKTRITNLLIKRKARFYQWHDYKKDVYQTLNKKKAKNNRKKKDVVQSI